MNMPTPELESYTPVSIGAQLRACRERAQLTIDDVSHHLKLTRRQVIAIENDEFGALPGPTFVRGFIRNYARLLRIDPEPLLQAGNLLPTPTAAIESIGDAMGELPAARRRSSSWTRWLIPAGLVVLLVAGIYEYGGVPASMRKARKDVAESTGAPAATAAPTVTAVEGASSPAMPAASTDTASSATAASNIAGQPASPATASPSTADATKIGESAAGNRPATSADQPAAPATGRVDVAVSRPAWIEVRDARGEVLVSRILPADSQQSVTGTVPLTLKIGNAAAVRVAFNGSPVDLAPYTQREVARFTLPPRGR